MLVVFQGISRCCNGSSTDTVHPLMGMNLFVFGRCCNDGSYAHGFVSGPSTLGTVRALQAAIHDSHWHRPGPRWIAPSQSIFFLGGRHRLQRDFAFADGQVGMPKAHQQDDAAFVRVVVHRVLKRVVKDYHFPHFPVQRWFVGDAQVAAVTVTGLAQGHDQSQVCGPAHIVTGRVGSNRGVRLQEAPNDFPGPRLGQ